MQSHMTNKEYSQNSKSLVSYSKGSYPDSPDMSSWGGQIRKANAGADL